MLRRLRENGPVLLVPAAWTLATLGHAGAVETRTVFIAHLVMDAVLLAFAALSWSDMAAGTLRVWRSVLVAGLAVTLAGTVGFLLSPPNSTLLGGTVLGWMLLPAAGLWLTGRDVPAGEAPRVYTAGAALSLLGVVAYLPAFLGFLGVEAMLVGLTLTNLGQTAGIANAVYQY
jgi:hypothetical protein